MKDFIFQNTVKVYFGKDHLKNLPNELGIYGSRVLLVYGSGSIKNNGIYDEVINLMQKSNIKIFELSGVEPNPRHTTVNKGVKICRENNVDVILAVGGGSTIDCAKAIAGTTLSDTGDIWDFVEGKVTFDKALPIITVLTLSATGSEMNGGSVITNLDLNRKVVIRNDGFLPKVSFLNPEYTYTVSKYQTACGVVDTMAHIFDYSYFCKGDQMDMITSIQEEIFRTVIKYAPIALKEPENYEARANLMWASSYALNGFVYAGNETSRICHIIEHELSAYYDITHGHGLAIIIPRWLEYILDDTTAPIIKRFGVNCFGLDSGLAEMEGAKKAIECLATFFFETLGLEKSLTAIGIDDKYFYEMAKNTCFGGVIKGLKDLNHEDIENIFNMCL